MESPENPIISPSVQPPPVFTARSYGDLSAQCGTLGCTVRPCTGITGSQGIPPNFSLLHVNVGPPIPQPLPLHATPHLLASPPISVSTPPTHLDECGFFKSLVVRLPHSSIFWQFWTLFVLRFSCNSLCGCMRQSVSTYTSILTRSPFFIRNALLVSSGLW